MTMPRVSLPPARRRRLSGGGFSMVELIIVVIIIAVLSSVVISGMRDPEKAAFAVGKKHAEAIWMAETKYYANTHLFTTSWASMGMEDPNKTNMPYTVKFNPTMPNKFQLVFTRKGGTKGFTFDNNKNITTF